MKTQNGPTRKKKIKSFSAYYAAMRITKSPVSLSMLRLLTGSNNRPKKEGLEL